MNVISKDEQPIRRPGHTKGSERHWELSELAQFAERIFRRIYHRRDDITLLPDNTVMLGVYMIRFSIEVTDIHGLVCCFRSDICHRAVTGAFCPPP